MATLKSYLTGFIISLLLILVAYIPVSLHVAAGHLAFPHSFLVPLILGLAVVQAILQLRFFLHLGAKSGWSLTILISTLGIVLILIVGSIWIMNHLNYNMTPQDMNKYIDGQDGL